MVEAKEKFLFFLLFLLLIIKIKMKKIKHKTSLHQMRENVSFLS